MGALADSVVAYARPLIDATDGSQEQLSRAFTISQLCWNLALLPEEARAESLANMRPALQMDDDEFEAFQRTVVVSMIQRHKEMFPSLHQRRSIESSTAWAPTTTPTKMGKQPGTRRNAPCPCGSGRKYKHCCGRP